MKRNFSGCRFGGFQFSAKGLGGDLFPEQWNPSFFCKKRTPFARGLERRIDKEE